jgi:hypothetical protein
MTQMNRKKKKGREAFWNLLTASLILAAGLWWHWSTWLTFLLVLIVLADPRERWKELLEAIRGRKYPNEEEFDGQEEFETQQKYDRMVETAHSQSEFKHIKGRPWGDPSSYVKNSALDELQQQEKAQTEQKREAEARASLNREAKRILQKREAQRNRAAVVSTRKCTCGGTDCLACYFGLPNEGEEVNRPTEEKRH